MLQEFLGLIVAFLVHSAASESTPIIIKPVIKHAPPKPIPVISHASGSITHERGSSVVRTHEKCHIEEVELLSAVVMKTVEHSKTIW